jgi:hypothetical protein
MHPSEFRATHLVRRVSTNEVRLLANVLPQMRPGQLLEAHAGRAAWPHKAYELYWPRANARSFAASEVPPSADVDIERVIRETGA